MVDTIIIGSGFAGAVTARCLADKGQKVLVIEERKHIGGNCYDEEDEQGILVHKYGPHIFHTNDEEVFGFLSKYTQWYHYSHEVVAYVNGKFLPIPFNLNTMEMVFGLKKMEALKAILLKQYGKNAKVPILDLKNSSLEDIRKIADYVYQNVFLKYTMKQWGKRPEEIDASVTARVPVVLSYDNRYFQDKYQGMPLNGYTNLFNNLFDHSGIEVRTNTKAKDVLQIQENQHVLYKGEVFKGKTIYTGAIDELFDCRFGRLPYRSLKFCFEQYNKESYQPKGVVNYTVSEDYTRITEFKYLTGQKEERKTTIMKEYPIKYEGKNHQIPYYAIINDENMLLYERYKKLADSIPGFYLLGRLADYKYYDIDAIVKRALDFGRTL